MLYVKMELSYDNFYPNSHSIYRIQQQLIRPQGKSYAAATPAPLAPALKQEYPEIEHITRVYFDDQVLIEYDEKRIFEDEVIYADPDFFRVFPFRIIQGDPSHLLDTPDSLVLTISMAQKYFGDQSPLSKVIRINNQYDFVVTGIMEDVPANSHYHFDCVVSFLAKNEENFGTWLNLWTGRTTLYTYAVLPESLNLESLTTKVEDIITRHSGQRPSIIRKIYFQPLRSIHLHSHVEDEIEYNNFVSNLIILSTIAVLILIIACINYINLATALSAQRAKEVGMRKVLGARRFQLVRQFMGESLLLTGFAMMMALIFVEFLLPVFSNLVRKPLDLIYGENLLFLTGFFLFMLLVGTMSSIYPAAFISRYQPVRAIKGIKDSSRGSSGHVIFKKTLVIVQFVVSIVLIVCTFVVNQQLHFVKNAHMGFDKAHTLVLPILSDAARNQYEAIKHEFVSQSGVIGATACLRSPISGNILITRAFPEGRDSETNFYVHVNSIDYDYLSNFDIGIVAGRNFSRQFATDAEQAFIINEATVRKWGLSSPADALGRKLPIGIGVEGVIVGVIKDFHISSFHHEIEPVVMIHRPDYFWEMGVKIKSNNVPETLAGIERTWAKFMPEYPFTFSFLDEDVDRLYAGEEQTAEIVRTFSIVAIFIACIGLLGLAVYSAESRTKEIGIRKVLGASVPQIVYILSSEFTRWVLAANIIAWPLAYYAMNRWLQGFAYRIHIGISTFILAAIIAFSIALLTVSFQSIKSALTDPVEALRYE